MTEQPKRPRRIYPPAQQPAAADMSSPSPSDRALPKEFDATASVALQKGGPSTERRGSGDYEVGYGRPPKANRFQPGQSGNPKGRSKGAKGFHTLLREELDAKVVAHEQGKATKLTKQHIAIKRLVNKAVEGDHRAFRTVFELLGARAGFGSPAAIDDRPVGGDAATLADEDRGILDDFIAKVLEARVGTAHQSASAECAEPDQPPKPAREADR